MNEILEILQNYEGMFTSLVVFTALNFIFIAWHVFMYWMTKYDEKSRKYKEGNLEFLDRRIKNELNYSRRLFTDNACEISRLKEELYDTKVELQKIKNKKK